LACQDMPRDPQNRISNTLCRVIRPSSARTSSQCSPVCGPIP